MLPWLGSYNWVKEQRKLALTRAFMLLRREGDKTVGREDWVRLMACLRPDCNAGHVSDRVAARLLQQTGSSGSA